MVELIITFGLLLAVLLAAVLWQRRQARKPTIADERSGE